MLAISVGPEVIVTVGGFPITNTLLVAGFLFFVFIGLIFSAYRSAHILPGKGIGGVLDAFTEALFDFIQSITNDEKRSIRFFPIVATIFLVVLLSNLIELVPGMGSIGVWGLHHGERALIPFIRSLSADLNFTFAIALFAMVSVQVLGVRMLGFSGYFSRFFVPPWKKPYFIGSFVGVLELVSEFSKVLSFSFRLFGNIFAGEVLLAVIGFLAPFIAPLPFLFLELFVGFVQALVFATLTTVFLTMATTAHDHDEDHADAHHKKADYTEASFGAETVSGS